MSAFQSYVKSSIGKKQIVAVTGLFLMVFIVFHLSANMLIFLGPEIYNFFPEKARSTGIVLKLAELGLAALFLTHIGFTAMLVKDNIQARKKRYEVYNPAGSRSLATRLMPVTGTILLVYLFTHIADYTLADHAGPNTIIDGVSQGAYGLVYNSFASPIRVVWYVVAMFAIGLHLAHAIQSIFQTFGFNHPKYTPLLSRLSTGLGILIGGLFSSIPLYFTFLHAG